MAEAKEVNTKKISTQGGARKGAGRKAKSAKEKKISKTWMIDPALVIKVQLFARSQGGVSEGAAVNEMLRRADIR